MLAKNDEECYTDSKTPMSKSRAVSGGCSDMRLGKGKLRSMHIRLNCFRMFRSFY